MSATMNRIGLPRDAYKGAATTLCAGCGHNSITNHMVKALYELGVEPHLLAKMSGIGCSSKTPAYFVETAHGFNGVHGRMPALTTGRHWATGRRSCSGPPVTAKPPPLASAQSCPLSGPTVDATNTSKPND